MDGAIHRAGGPTILRECRELRASRFPDRLPTGQAVATGAGDLPARWVIHTVGPVYGRVGDHDDDDKTTGSELLADCYRNSLTVADELGARTVAFPLISTGAYGWPSRCGPECDHRATAHAAGPSPTANRQELVARAVG